MPGADLSTASGLAERLRGGRARRLDRRLHGSEVAYTISLGVAEAMAGDTPISISQRAEAAVLASRASGKNCTHLHNGAACNLVESAVALMPNRGGFRRGRGFGSHRARRGVVSWQESPSRFRRPRCLCVIRADYLEPILQTGPRWQPSSSRVGVFPLRRVKLFGPR